MSLAHVTGGLKFVTGQGLVSTIACVTGQIPVSTAAGVRGQSLVTATAGVTDQHLVCVWSLPVTSMCPIRI